MKILKCILWNIKSWNVLNLYLRIFRFLAERWSCWEILKLRLLTLRDSWTYFYFILFFKKNHLKMSWNRNIWTVFKSLYISGQQNTITWWQITFIVSISVIFHVIKMLRKRLACCIYMCVSWVKKKVNLSEIVL